MVLHCKGGARVSYDQGGDAQRDTAPGGTVSEMGRTTIVAPSALSTRQSPSGFLRSAHRFGAVRQSKRARVRVGDDEEQLGPLPDDPLLRSYRRQRKGNGGEGVSEHPDARSPPETQYLGTLAGASAADPGRCRSASGPRRSMQRTTLSLFQCPSLLPRKSESSNPEWRCSLVFTE